MIIGHGIDLQEISAIQAAVDKHPNFPQRILTEDEMARYRELPTKRRLAYLAGRWAAKEAFSKAMGTGIGTLGFLDIEILSDRGGAPYVNRSPFEGKIWISISHSGNFVQASVILEEDHESKQ
ncbi:holo-ACP synthase [Streptococcus suis]|nr:holo-ACP synthase [Streptococcus suis]